MAIYTTAVRSICESLANWNQNGFYNQSQIIETARPLIFDFNYPNFDEQQKTNLETNILKYYYFEEIGLETYNQWKLKLNAKLNTIMPKYVKMYELIAENVKPFDDTDYERTKDEDNHLTTTDDSTSTVNGTNWELYSDTPQGGVSGLDAGNYLTNATKSTNNSTTTFDDDGAQQENKNLIERIKGKRGNKSYAQLMAEYYDKDFYNIDLMIINELSDLFMGLWR